MKKRKIKGLTVGTQNIIPLTVGNDNKRIVPMTVNNDRKIVPMTGSDVEIY